MHTVSLAHLHGLPLELERGASFGSRRQVKRPAVQILPFAERSPPVSGALDCVETTQQAAPLVHAVGSDGRKKFVRGFETRHGRVIVCGSDEQRTMARSQ